MSTPKFTALPAATVSELESFFSQAGEVIDQAEARQREIDRGQATRFNILRMFEPDENKISDILADLLDPRGTHGQGDRFLRVLLEQLQPDLVSRLKSVPRVQREAPTFGILKYQRRIDILIYGDVLVAVENKVDSLEQFEQVKDYLEHLRKRSGFTPAFLIYLTPNGRRPDSLSPQELEEHLTAGRLHLWSYAKQLRTWLEACGAECKADKVRHFLADFIVYIDSDLKRKEVTDEGEEQP
jgi:hypothetical protein